MLQNRISVLAAIALAGGSMLYADHTITRIVPGTTITVRTDELIDTRNVDGAIYQGTVAEDVRGNDGQLAVPRGATVELAARSYSRNELVVDLESIVINGQRYAVSANERVFEGDRRKGVGSNTRTGKYVGGGAVLGSIIGAIAGGGKGAAIGAATGAAAGAGTQTLTRGGRISVPAESVITFRIERPLTVGVPDDGFMRDGRHYHDYRRWPQ